MDAPANWPSNAASSAPPRSAGGRIRRWWLSRHPVTDTWSLSQHNIYILPTKGGWVFGLTLLVMLVSAINYQLNLGYVLTFLLAGSGIVSMHVTHSTLRGSPCGSSRWRRCSRAMRPGWKRCCRAAAAPATASG